LQQVNPASLPPSKKSSVGIPPENCLISNSFPIKELSGYEFPVRELKGFIAFKLQQLLINMEIRLKLSKFGFAWF
jgi:hypothetical protein